MKHRGTQKGFGWFLIVSVLAIACAKEKAHKTKSPKESENPYFQLLLSNMAAYQGDLDVSLKKLDKAIGADPSSAYLHYLKALREASRKAWTSSMTSVDKALQLKPDWTKAIHLKAQILSATEDHLGATKLLESLIRKEPGNQDIYFRLAGEYLDLKRYEEALGVLRRLLVKIPEVTEAHYWMANILSQHLKRYGEAIESYQKILAFEPDNIRVRSAIAQIYLHQEKKELALRHFLEIERRYPDDFGIQLQTALLLYEMDRLSEAVGRFENVLKHNPKADRVRYYLGFVYEKSKRIDEALQEYEKVGEGSVVFKEAKMHMAFIYRERGDPKQAIRILEDAVAQGPRVSEFYELLAILWEEGKKLTKAVDWLRRGIKNLPEEERLYFNLAILYDKLDDRDSGIATMRRVLEINPDNASALNYIGYTYAERGVHLEEALQMIEKALKIKPNDGYIADSLGWVYYQMGDLERAFHTIDKALKLVPAEPTVNEHMGDIYLKKGNVEKALEYYRRAIDLEKKKNEPDLEEIRRVEGKIGAMEK